MAADVRSDVTDCIGRTPLVRLARFYRPSAAVEILAKLEYLNPGGSVKDRVALSMVRDAERRGLLRAGGTIVEPTAGNTGIALAMVASVLGYRCLCVVPERFSQEKQVLMRALGAQVVNTATAEGMEGAIARAHELVRETPGACIMQQFSNPVNADAHYLGTGPEIWEQSGGRVDAVVLGAGTGGTLTGTVRFLKEKNPRLYAVIVQPYGATLGEPPHLQHKVEGIGIDNIDTAAILDRGLFDRVVTVRDEDAHAALKELARLEGMLVGSSSGAAAHAARLVAGEIAGGRLPLPGGSVVTLFPDGSDRYLSKHIYGSFEEWRA